MSAKSIIRFEGSNTRLLLSRTELSCLAKVFESVSEHCGTSAATEPRIMSRLYYDIACGMKQKMFAWEQRDKQQGLFNIGHTTALLFAFLHQKVAIDDPYYKALIGSIAEPIIQKFELI